MLISQIFDSNFTCLQYGVVFDAGSSHTAAYVYQWPGNERLRGTAIPVSEIYKGTHEPGGFNVYSTF